MLNQPIIINLAPTGAVADHLKNPNVPITVGAIAEQVSACARAGAGIAHLHIRDAAGAPTCDPTLFAELFALLRADASTCDLVLCATTSGRHGQTPERRAAVLNLPAAIRPDMASLTLGSLNFPTGASVNAPDTIRYLADRMKEASIKPELEVFDLGMIEFAKVLIGEGRLSPPYYFNIILGNTSSLPCDLRTLSFVTDSLPQPAVISIGGVGRAQMKANTFGLVAADGIRVGLEDNLWITDANRSPASNLTMVEDIVKKARALGRVPASPDEVRRLLNLRRCHDATPKVFAR